MKVTLDDLREVSPNIDEKFFWPWRLLLLCWLNMWKASAMQISARNGWDYFSRWIPSAANRAFDLGEFLAHFARKAQIVQLGTNVDEREVIAEAIALAATEQRRVLKTIRNQLPVLLTLLRMYQQIRKETYEYEEDRAR
jgi:hypothetical protein